MTKIEWTERTWNPIVGCSIVSPGCTNCYAMQMAARIERMDPKLEHYRGLTKKVNGHVVWTGKINLAPEKTLLEPLSWKKPHTVFVNSMSDLFHEDVPDEWITAVFVVMMVAHEHTFQILTKRSRRMREWMTAPNRAGEMAAAIRANGLRLGWGGPLLEDALGRLAKWPWPPPNVWLGVSCERQQEADERIPDLLATPAALRFVSAEPLLGPIDFTALQSNRQPEEYEAEVTNALTGELFWEIDGTVSRAMRRTGKLDWIIVGGESGPGARPMVLGWAKDIVRQCKTAGVPVFVKQLGAEPTNREGERCPHIKQKKGADVSEWPAELRVREWPHA
jgi:protein gp37